MSYLHVSVRNGTRRKGDNSFILSYSEKLSLCLMVDAEF